MKKTWILLVLSILAMALLSSCAGTADTLPSPAPMVSVSPSAAPMITNTPMVSISPAVSPMPTSGVGGAAEMGNGGVNTVEDAKRISDDVEDEIEKLSEVDDAEAVVAGNIALVGIKYDTQYQGGLTERLTEMAKTRVETIDKTITAVHVTDDEAMRKKIDELNDKLDKGDITFEELQTQVLDIGSNIAGGGNSQVTQTQKSLGA